MSDIVERLRAVLDEASLGPGHWEPIEDAIAEIERLREALEPFAALQVPKRVYSDSGKYSIFHDDIGRARAALAKDVGQ